MKKVTLEPIQTPVPQYTSYTLPTCRLQPQLSSRIVVRYGNLCKYCKPKTFHSMVPKRRLVLRFHTLDYSWNRYLYSHASCPHFLNLRRTYTYQSCLYNYSPIRVKDPSEVPVYALTSRFCPSRLTRVPGLDWVTKKSIYFTVFLCRCE